VEELTCEKGIPYISLSNGTIITYPAYKERAKKLFSEGKILRNEIGCFKKEFTQCYKNETLSATFIISSNIFPLFEGRHFYIRNLEVLGYSPSFWKLNAQNIASTQRIYIDFKNAKVVITPFKGLPVNILKGFIWLITLLSVIIFLAIWYIWGRDKEVIVPTYVSEIPNPKREPWQVFMLTELNDYKIPEILLYQLYNKGALKIEQPKDKKFIISLSKELSISSLSTAEKEAFYLLKKRLEGGYKKQLIKKEKDSYIIDFSGRNLQREKLAGLLTNLIEGLKELPSIKEFERDIVIYKALGIAGIFLGISLIALILTLLFNSDYGTLETFLFLLFLSFLILISSIFKLLFLLLYFILMQFLVPKLFLSKYIFLTQISPETYMIFVITLFSSLLWAFLYLFPPVQLLSRYKKDFYREALMWLAFKNTLKDYAKLEQNFNLNFLKKVIPYALALGLLENLKKYMPSSKFLEEALDFIEKIEKLKRTSTSVGTGGTGSGSASSGGGSGGGGGR
jgi:uncharacterized membrane protein YgcG